MAAMHILDELGDVILVLRTSAGGEFAASNAPVSKKAAPSRGSGKKRGCGPDNAPGTEQHSKKSTKRKRKGTLKGDPSSISADEPATTIHRYRVSSERLCGASPVFKAMIEGPWVESKGRSTAPKEIRTSDFEPRALLVVLHLMHFGTWIDSRARFGIPRQSPRNVGHLCDIAVIADYYGCRELLRHFKMPWGIPRPRNFFGKTPCEESQLAKGLFAAAMFRYSYHYEAVETAIVAFARGPLQTDLPISLKLIEQLEAKRMEAVNRAVGIVRHEVARLRNGTLCCGECYGAHLGMVMEELSKTGLLNERMSVFNNGISAWDIYNFLSRTPSMERTCPRKCPPLRWESWCLFLSGCWYNNELFGFYR